VTRDPFSILAISFFEGVTEIRSVMLPKSIAFGKTQETDCSDGRQLLLTLTEPNVLLRDKRRKAIHVTGRGGL
jgi:hypothetical protein